MTDYEGLCRDLAALGAREAWYVPFFANAAALLWSALPRINWAGFYLVRGERLVLGPFQGKVACVHIAAGRGVCGTAWQEDRTVTVDDVHTFAGHIACDAASRSEIVIPLHAGGRVAAVLDIDSPDPARFTAADRAGLEAFARVLESAARFEE